MTPIQAACILNARNALVAGIPGEASHWLYRAADFHCTNPEPWEELEKVASKRILVSATDMAAMAEAFPESNNEKELQVVIRMLETKLSSCTAEEVPKITQALETLQLLLEKP